MLNGFIYGLITAWILSWFGVDNIIITSTKEILKLTISESTYYVAAGLIGLVAALVDNI